MRILVVAHVASTLLCIVSLLASIIMLLISTITDFSYTWGVVSLIVFAVSWFARQVTLALVEAHMEALLEKSLPARLRWR